MAFIQCNFKSDVLGKMCAMNVILPQAVPAADPDFPHAPRMHDRRYPVVFLLHGLSDDHSAWCRRTSIERYADRLGCAVVMPDGGRSFYTDAVNGPHYGTFLADELPEIAASLFPISLKKEDCFAAGLSMGGYGALRLALTYPNRFAAVAGLSNVCDMEIRFTSPDTASWLPELRNIFGSVGRLAERDNDLYVLAARCVESGKPLPKILSIYGVDDFMVKDNRKFSEYMEKIGYPEFHRFERPGAHSWEFWDEHIWDALVYFFKNQLPE